MSDTKELALLLIKEVRDALASGTKHYDIHNNLLATDKKIIEALVKDGKITTEPKKE